MAKQRSIDQANAIVLLERETSDDHEPKSIDQEDQMTRLQSTKTRHDVNRGTEAATELMSRCEPERDQSRTYFNIAIGGEDHPQLTTERKQQFLGLEAFLNDDVDTISQLVARYNGSEESSK
ncbi:unnamed protein product [Camellia sinensis]